MNLKTFLREFERTCTPQLMDSWTVHGPDMPTDEEPHHSHAEHYKPIRLSCPANLFDSFGEDDEYSEPVECYCPITAVCGRVLGYHYLPADVDAAIRDLELDRHAARLIIMAADYDQRYIDRHDPEHRDLRAKLIACTAIALETPPPGC